MKYIIQARRIECPVINFKQLQDIYNQDIAYIDYISPAFREVLGRNLKSKLSTNLLVKIRQHPPDIEIHKDWNGKIWAVIRFEYLYEGKLEQEYHRWYGTAHITPLLKYFNCKQTMFIHTIWEEDNYFNDACNYFLYPIEDKLLYGKSRHSKVSSLKDILRLNMLTPLFILKRRDLDERDWDY